MKTFFTYALPLLFFVACGTHNPAPQQENERDFYWEGKKVSKKKFDRKLYRYTMKTIKNSPEEQQKLLSELSVSYDTIPAKEKKEVHEEKSPTKE